jgi:hypothetical protein
MSAGAIAVSVRIAAWAKPTARVKTAASPHTEAPAHMAAAAATPTARERVRSSETNDHRDSRKQRGRGLQL